jgi:hypothetical protein
MRAWNKVHAGNAAATPVPQGYLTISVNDRTYYTHRIIWKMMTGVDPNPEIDHRDLDKKNNRWRNLRQASSSKNQANTRHQRAVSGVRGVRIDRHNLGRFMAEIMINGKSHYLGTFDTIEEASAAYCEAGRKYFSEFFNPDPV